MMSLGGGEIMVLVVLVLVLFGPDKLPELARGFGKGMREIRKITSEFQSQLNVLAELDDEKPKPPSRNRPVQRPQSEAAARPATSAEPPASKEEEPAGVEPVREASPDQQSLF